MRFKNYLLAFFTLTILFSITSLSKDNYQVIEKKRVYDNGIQKDPPKYICYNYDTNNRLKISYYRSFRDEAWDTTAFCHFEYDKNDSLILEWYEGETFRRGWGKIGQYIFEYNKDGWSKIKTQQKYITNYETMNERKDYEKYNGKGYLVEQMKKVWYSDDDHWHNVYRKFYEYDKFDRVKKYQHKYWDSSNEIWITSSKNIYHYNSNDLIDTIIDIDLNRKSKSWDTTYIKNFYKFDNKGRVIEHSSGEIQGDSVIISVITTTEYNDEENYVRTIDKEIFKNEWINVFKWEDYFDDNNNLIKETHSEWSLYDSVWEYEYWYEYKYRKYTNVKEKLPYEIYSKVFPNPNSGTFQIDLNTPEIGTFNIKIYDIMGNIVYDQMKNKRSPNCTWNIELNNLPNGLYNYRISNNGKYKFGGQILINK